MQFVIERTTMDKKGKKQKSFFQDRNGRITEMTSDISQARIFHKFGDAEATRQLYFGNNRKFKTITHQSEQQSIGGSIRTGHDSGIF